MFFCFRFLFIYGTMNRNMSVKVARFSQFEKGISNEPAQSFQVYRKMIIGIACFQANRKLFVKIARS